MVKWVHIEVYLLVEKGENLHLRGLLREQDRAPAFIISIKVITIACDKHSLINNSTLNIISSLFLLN